MSVDELYFAMIDVGYTALKHRIAGAKGMIRLARDSLETWREDEKAATLFAKRMLESSSTPIDSSEFLQNLTSKCDCTSNKGLLLTTQLPDDLARACWRLSDILEYFAYDEHAQT